MSTFTLYKLIESKWTEVNTLKGRRKDLAEKLRKEEKLSSWKLRQKNES